jgi:hypothetical protein
MDQFSANEGSDIMLTLGSDFEYSNAYTWYKNLDKLIDYVNKDGTYLNSTFGIRKFRKYRGSTFCVTAFGERILISLRSCECLLFYS